MPRLPDDQPSIGPEDHLHWWTTLVRNAREEQSSGRGFESPVQRRGYRVEFVEPERVFIRRLSTNTGVWITRRRAEKAVEAIVAAGGRVRRRDLIGKVAMKTGLVLLHPALDWDEDRSEVIFRHPSEREDEFAAELLAAAESIRLRATGRQGYLDSPEIRRAIELHAMKRAEAYFRRQGFEVTDVSKRESYDLHCGRGDEILYVEVKGTQGAGDEILLTPNEVRFAQMNSERMALFVVSNVTVREGNRPIVVDGTERVWWPWSISIGVLKSTGYIYAVG